MESLAFVWKIVSTSLRVVQSFSLSKVLRLKSRLGDCRNLIRAECFAPRSLLLVKKVFGKSEPLLPGSGKRFGVYLLQKLEIPERVGLISSADVRRSDEKMKLFSKVMFGGAILLFLACSSGRVYADGIVLVNPDIQKLVPPLAALNLQHHGNSTTEAGGVRFNGSGDVDFGDISAGPHQHTVSLTELGVGQASNLRVLLNINETNGGDKAPITVDSLL